MTRKFRPAVGMAALMTAVALPGVVHAQSVAAEISDTTAESNFARDRNVGVRERPHPEFEAQGVRFGAFMAYPRVEIAVEHDDNIFPTTPGPQEDDVIWRVKPQINVVSGWSRHQMELWAAASVNRFTDHESENTTDWRVGGHLRLDLAERTTVEAKLEHADLTEPRTSSNAVGAQAEPVQYTMDEASLGIAKEFNRLRLGAGVDWRKFDYDDVRRIAPPGVIEQDDRDRLVTAVTGRADYAISPATAVFVETTWNDRAFDTPTPVPAPILFAERDSSGYSVLAGVNFELSNLTRGEIGVGYLDQNYDSPAFADISGFGYRAKLEWFPSQLTTVTATAARSVEDSGFIGGGGYLFTDLGVQVDHELFRNVILTGQFSWTKSEYEFQAPGASREDDRSLIAVSATWLVNRRVGLNVGFSHLNQDSSGTLAGPEFDDNKVGAALVLQF